MGRRIRLNTLIYFGPKSLHYAKFHTHKFTHSERGDCFSPGSRCETSGVEFRITCIRLCLRGDIFLD